MTISLLHWLEHAGRLTEKKKIFNKSREGCAGFYVNPKDGFPTPLSIIMNTQKKKKQLELKNLSLHQAFLIK